MVNVTRHALEMYAQRIKGKTETEAKLNTVEYKDLYIEEINKMVDNSKLIYTGKFNNNQEAKFRLAGDVCLILDIPETKVITLYRVDFGFNTKTNRLILENLNNDLREAENKYLEASLKIQEEVNILTYQETQLSEEILEIQKALANAKEKLKALKEYKKTVKASESIYESEMHKIAKQIVYSIHYKIAMQETF